ncbi:MAG: winged helix DNA-binding domain-containing protein [Verrucomicrobia bacterium]|nr:winged helix DNA-binding domain-containing protein [Verrucomicrobiota bacterium]MDA1086584.1 winged helix DNA-binding domain-containing protein [Verrucomicrobiota bacterium]
MSVYAPEMLHELQAADRRVFEYWARAACYLPMSDYRYYLPRMRAVTKSQHNWFYTPEARAVTDHVLERIRDEGPLRSADFKHTRKKRGSWWDWKPAKRALEMLFDMGKLMVTERRSFQRVYDLTERVLPPETNTTLPTSHEIGRFVVRRVLSTKGFAASGELCWERHRPASVDDALRELVDSGDVVAAHIPGREGPVFALCDAIDAATKRSRRKDRLHILSPFDNAVIDRRRLSALFDFDCKLECYFPASKRTYGYFCLPILWGQQFVGRIDAKAYRSKKTLVIKHLMFEAAFSDFDAVAAPLADKLVAFAGFNGCERILVEKCTPTKARPLLRKEIRGSM